MSALDDYCERAIKDWKGPGLSVAVIRDGKLLTVRGYGVRKLGEARPVTKDTVCAIASCTKLFTSAIIGKLVAQKQVAWDDPISQHLPLFAGQSKGPISRVTIRQALQHRTGFSTSNILWRTSEFDRNKIIQRVRLLQPVAKPGKKFLYNNVMYLAAGMVAEKVSGKSWSDLVTTEFLKPLDMKHTRPNAIKGPFANKLPNWYRKSFDGSVRMRGCRMHKLSMDWNRSLMRS